MPASAESAYDVRPDVNYGIEGLAASCSLCVHLLLLVSLTNYLNISHLYINYKKSIWLTI